MKTQKGFALIELLVAIVIIALISLSAATGVFQVFKVSGQNNDISTSIRQAQNVGYWVSHDASMAGGLVPTSNSNIDEITMSWSTWALEVNYIYQVNYSGFPSGSLYKIQRQIIVHDVDGNLRNEMGGTIIIADNIKELHISPQDTYWVLSIEAHSGESQVVTREYVIKPRVNY